MKDKIREIVEDWIYSGGGGMEIDRGDEKALSVSFYGLVDMLKAYHEHLYNLTRLDEEKVLEKIYFAKHPEEIFAITNFTDEERLIAKTICDQQDELTK